MDGWFVTRTRGPCRQYSHASKGGLLTIAGRPGDEFAPNTLKSIFGQVISDEVFDSYREDGDGILSIFS